MAQTWAPVIKSMQDQIVTQILAQWNTDRLSLTAPLGGAAGEVDVIADLPHNPRDHLKAVVICVWPAEGDGNMGWPSNSGEAVVTFPVFINVRFRTRTAALTLIREAVGLVVDGVNSDLLLNDTANGGPAEPTFVFGLIEDLGGEFQQEVKLRFIRSMGP